MKNFAKNLLAATIIFGIYFAAVAFFAEGPRNFNDPFFDPPRKVGSEG